DGLGGKKEALVKDIYFDIVTDASTRVAGIQSGEYDIAFAIPFESYAQLMNAPNVNLEPVYISNMDLLYNKQGGLMEDFKMREAVNTALDIDDILQASFADEELYLVDSGYMSRILDTGQVTQVVTSTTRMIQKRLSNYSMGQVTMGKKSLS